MSTEQTNHNDSRAAVIEIQEVTDKGAVISAVKKAAQQAGFNQTDQYLIATAASELATNTARYGGGGVVRVRRIETGDKSGVEIEAQDAGPGIEDIDKVMQDHYSSGKSLGLGLPGVDRIMDELVINSRPGRGTRCIARKWRDT